MISRFQRATETAEMIFNHLLSTPSAGGLGNVKGAKRSGAFISTLDIPKTGGYLEFSRDRLHLDKSFSKNAASVLTNSGPAWGPVYFFLLGLPCCGCERLKRLHTECNVGRKLSLQRHLSRAASLLHAPSPV